MPERAGSAALFGGDMLYGAALYPEACDEATFVSDAAHMRRLGMNTARIGEFMWSALEPEEGGIELDVLHRALDTLAANGLRAIVCTPTVTPPVRLTDGHSERLHRQADGTVLGHGSRQHICTNHPEFRRRAALITEAGARAVGDDERVVAWQLDNEFKSHVSGCFCAGCRRLWADWLRGRYRVVAELNRRWVTAVWSETYQAFEQVPLPGPTPFLHNTSLLTEFEAFSRAMLNAFATEQTGIFRRFSSLPVTHNSGFGFSLENEELFADLDFSSFDTYPAASNYPAFLMNLDYFPRLGKAGRSLLMETSPSHSGSVARYGTAHPAGFVEAEAFAGFASGAAGFLFWHFRQHRGGSEQPHGSVISTWELLQSATRPPKLWVHSGPGWPRCSRRACRNSRQWRSPTPTAPRSSLPPSRVTGWTTAASSPRSTRSSSPRASSAICCLKAPASPDTGHFSLPSSITCRTTSGNGFSVGSVTAARGWSVP